MSLPMTLIINAMKCIGMEYEKQPIMKPLSKACGLLLADEYFDDETLLTKVPSYAWYVEDKIAAFVLNAQCEIPEYLHCQRRNRSSVWVSSC